MIFAYVIGLTPPLIPPSSSKQQITNHAPYRDSCGTALFSDGYANGIIGSVNTILRRLYPAELKQQDYGTILSSLAFAGTVVGMLSFGYISDKVGRKFGMMTATLIVAVFSALSAASKGAGGSTIGMLQALSAYR
jgi:MFS family permease